MKFILFGNQSSGKTWLSKKINFKGEKKPNFKHKPIIYQIYDYLKENVVGYEKRLKSNAIMEQFNITDNTTFRKYIEEIRQSEVLQKIVCSEAGYKGGYWIATNDKEVNDTLNHLYKRAMEMLKTYSIIKNKYKLNGQYRIKMTKYEKDIIESIIQEGK